MNKRLYYEAPETELFVVRFEENFLDSMNTTSSELSGRTRGTAGAAGGSDDFDGGTAYL